MGDPFVHLHVASGYSMRHGASHPAALVARAAEHGMDTLALTDRDGVYGAVRFVTACAAAGIRPVLGVDLAIGPDDPAPTRPGRAPAKAERDPRLPRATLLAVGGAGWSSVCRLVSATHLGGDRGTPVSSLRLVARHGESVVVLLGPDSALGRLVAARRTAAAAAELARWRAVVPRECLFVELVHHREEGTAALMRRLAAFAAEHDVPTVLTNAVRFADRSGAPVADALDAIRRLVPLTSRHVDATNAEAELKGGKEMRDLAEELTGSAADARRLLARTRILGERCVLDPKADLGIGTVHFPEPAAGIDAARALRERCDAGLARRGLASSPDAAARLERELEMVQGLGYPSYFLTVADVVDMVKSMGVRCAARGSGAGSLVNYALGISDVDPMRYGLLMERFLSPYRKELPDIDLDVESARRLDVYDAIFDRYGGDRVACVSMMDTYRVRHAIRDIGGALGLPPGEIDLIAKSFPHISARHVRDALAQLPELRASGLAGSPRLEQLYTLVEQLDGLPRHVAMHPCGVLLSDATLLDRTPVEASYLGYPMSQFDKDDVEQLGLLKLDVLGIRMQSTIAYALSEIERVDGEAVDVDAVPRDDPATYALVQSTKTLGMFQIESPGQRELVGKFAPETFNDLIIDISLFRPGPVKTDMVTPFLQARHGWRQPVYLHDDLRFALAETYGVVVFHEQVLQIVATMTGCSLSEADEVRRALSDPEGIARMRAWFRPLAARRGYPVEVIAKAWEVLEGFAAFGFCKAHAAAFALPTYQSAWLKAHHPAAFLAGVLTHDPGMYPKRLILDDARQFGIAVLPLDVNISDGCYRVEHIAMFDGPPPSPDGQLGLGSDPWEVPAEVPAEVQAEVQAGARRYGIRLSLADVKGITDAEVARIVAGRPYGGLSDFWHRAGVSRPVAERLVLAGGFDSLYGIGLSAPVRRRGQVTRRDLLLQVGDLQRWSDGPATRRRRGAGRGRATPGSSGPATLGSSGPAIPGSWKKTSPIGTEIFHERSGARGGSVGGVLGDTRARAAAQSQGAAPVDPVDVQLSFDVGPGAITPSGLPEMNVAERVRAELDVLGLDASGHVLELYEPLLAALRTTRARDMMSCRSRQQVLVAGVKVATQTPAVRSGTRVVFVTLDDATGPVDATFFADAQIGYAATLFHSWLLVVRGTVRRTGPRGVSMQADGCWDLTSVFTTWRQGGLAAVRRQLALPADGYSREAIEGAAASRSTRPVMTQPPRKLWHASPGSSGG